MKFTAHNAKMELIRMMNDGMLTNAEFGVAWDIADDAELDVAVVNHCRPLPFFIEEEKMYFTDDFGNAIFAFADCADFHAAIHSFSDGAGEGVH